jgi:hypothetical protein
MTILLAKDARKEVYRVNSTRACKPSSMKSQGNARFVMVEGIVTDGYHRWRKTVSHDLTIMHSALEQTLRALSLPALPSLHTPLPELGSLQ